MLNNMTTGIAYSKFYSEFRNGFRHPFSTSMVSSGCSHEQLNIFKNVALIIDKCLDKINYQDLKNLLTYDL